MVQCLLSDNFGPPFDVETEAEFSELLSVVPGCSFRIYSIPEGPLHSTAL